MNKRWRGCEFDFQYALCFYLERLHPDWRIDAEVPVCSNVADIAIFNPSTDKLTLVECKRFVCRRAIQQADGYSIWGDYLIVATPQLEIPPCWYRWIGETKAPVGLWGFNPDTDDFRILVDPVENTRQWNPERKLILKKLTRFRDLLSRQDMTDEECEFFGNNKRDLNE